MLLSFEIGVDSEMLSRATETLHFNYSEDRNVELPRRNLDFSSNFVASVRLRQVFDNRNDHPLSRGAGRRRIFHKGGGAPL